MYLDFNLILSGQAKLCGPVHSMGHTANVIANRMIVIFGHSPKYGYLSTVQVSLIVTLYIFSEIPIFLI
jgi:hypothetical protein